MKSILVLGAGRSSSSLIQYLLDQALSNDWRIVVADTTPAIAEERIKGHERGRSIAFDIQAPEAGEWIKQSDVVISLLPPHLHPAVARLCLQHRCHLLTASYVSDEMQGLHQEARAAGLTFINECGLDPGIDHMSAMKVIDGIRNAGGKMISFESFTGGLIAKDTDRENPWRYKFTWNPRNVVMAGQSVARYLEGGRLKFIPYQQLFARLTPVSVPGHGDYDGYANRDSLKYRELYGLQNVQTMLRGTLRSRGFCAAWNIFVQLGCCDDSYMMEQVGEMTHAGFLRAFLPGSSSDVRATLANYFSFGADAAEMHCLQWSGFFDETPVGLTKGTPAMILEHILNKRWKLNPHDRDEIVMWHKFVYEINGAEKEIQASLISTGTDSNFTAMAKTVGLPLGIAAKLLLSGAIQSKGVLIPTTPEFYSPILSELKSFGIELTETEVR